MREKDQIERAAGHRPWYRRSHSAVVAVGLLWLIALALYVATTDFPWER
jgi:hypothetical protein